VLSRALGERSSRVEFRDAPAWYPSPQAALAGYRALLEETDSAGVARTRIVGEVVLDGLSSAETQVWARYESLVNVLFASAAVSYICLYDTRTLPAEVIAAARHTHPYAIDGDTAHTNPLYRAPEDFLLESTR
jgi:hypothetical protein